MGVTEPLTSVADPERDSNPEPVPGPEAATAARDRAAGMDGSRPRAAAQVLADSRALVEPALRAAVDTLPGSMRQVAGYHLGWWDEHGQPLPTGGATGDSAPGGGAVGGSAAAGSAAAGGGLAGRAAGGGGKALRPALTLLSAEAMGAEPATAVPAAVAVELTHNFSLLHDDVMDGDTTRRHRATAWTVYGREAAILGGDALLTLALDVLAATERPAASPGIRMLSTAVQELLAGQSTDIGFERRAEVSMAECLAMARGKTGALLGCACALGASFAGAGEARTALLRGFGQQLGLAFQHVDDLLGIWGDPEATGKPVHSDLRSRKKSLPVVAALTSGGAAGRELAALYHADRPLSDAELAAAAQLTDAAGGRAYSCQQAEDLLADAQRQLDAARPAPRAAAELRALARLVATRDR